MHKIYLASSVQTNRHRLFGCPDAFLDTHNMKMFVVNSHNVHLPDSRKARMRRAQRNLLLMVVELNQHRLSSACFLLCLLAVFFFSVVVLTSH